MKRIFFITAILFSLSASAQTSSSPKVRWYFSPSVSTMLLDDHVGIAPGIEAGVKIWKQRLQIGIVAYNRSGPINPHTETLNLAEGQTYRGKSQLSIRADHGAIGLLVAPQFKFGRVTVDVPLIFGQVAGGFYLTGDDRITPDGRRVSEWEDELMGDTDAGAGFFVEGGIRAKVPLTPSGTVLAGLGVYYTQTLGLDTFVGGSTYYNAPRIAAFLQFGN